MKSKVQIRTHALEDTATLEKAINDLLANPAAENYAVLTSFVTPSFTDSAGKQIAPQIVTLFQKQVGA